MRLPQKMNRSERETRKAARRRGLGLCSWPDRHQSAVVVMGGGGSMVIGVSGVLAVGDRRMREVCYTVRSRARTS